MKIKNKEWYKSKTVWSALFTAGITILGYIFGQTDIVVTTLATIGTAMGLYGRVSATELIK